MRNPNCEEEYKGVMVIALFVISLILLVPTAFGTTAFSVVTMIIGIVGLIVSVWAGIVGMSDDEIELAWLFESDPKPETKE